jgi:hypothetical protein
LPWNGNAINWGKDPALVLTARDAIGKTIEPGNPVVDIAPNNAITIRPGAQLSGTILLESYFPSLEASLIRGDVGIEWRYQLRVSGRVITYTGLLVIKREQPSRESWTD